MMRRREATGRVTWRARSTRWASRLLLVMLLLSQARGVAGAARSVRILVVDVGSVPVAARAAVTASLRAFGEVLPERVYTAAVTRAALDPDDPGTLARVLPELGVALVVTLSAQRAGVVVRYYDGSRAEVVHELALPLRHRRLPAQARLQLTAANRVALQRATEAGGPAPAPAASEATAITARTTEPPPAPLEAADEAPETPEPEAVATPGEATPEPDTESRVALEPAPRIGFSAMLGAGAGIGTRNVHVPTNTGERRLDTGMFPALDLVLAGNAELGTYTSLGLAVHYQTSLGLHATELPPGGANERTSLRSHRLEVGVTPALRFTTTSASVSVRLFVGWWLRGLRPVVDLRIPANSLHGPVLRPELHVPLVADVLALRLAPELGIIAGMTSELRDMASARGLGLALGAEVALELQLGTRVRVLFAYRESHVAISTARMTSLSDAERFATLSLALGYL